MNPDLYQLQENFIDTGLLITALDTVSEGLIICDKDYRILYRNVASTLNDFIERPSKFKIYDLKTHVELSQSEFPLTRVVGGLKFTDFQIHVLSNETLEDFFFSCNGTPLIGKNNTIVGGVCTFKDITKGYLAERKMKEERAFYKNILDWIPAEILVYDDQNEFYFKNHRFERLQKTMNGNGATFSEMAREHDALVLKKLQAMEFDEQIDFPDGMRRMYRTIRFPIYHQSSQKVLICAIAFDMTETLAVENGHEIDTPISVMRSVTFMIREMMNDRKLTSTILKEKLDSMDSALDSVQKIAVSLKNLLHQSR